MRLPFVIALQSLRANPLRATLSTLGVIIGAAALVAVLAIGDGVEAYLRDQIERTSSLQLVSVAPRRWDEAGGVRVPRARWVSLDAAAAAGLAARLGARATV
ncbi:MAG: ABC transporter permease, partial [Gemmatimonadales bacterium]|nr:ABC transporter permease [Gemmatimonadales bacterium]